MFLLSSRGALVLARVQELSACVVSEVSSRFPLDQGVLSFVVVYVMFMNHEEAGLC